MADFFYAELTTYTIGELGPMRVFFNPKVGDPAYTKSGAIICQHGGSQIYTVSCKASYKYRRHSFIR